MAKTNQNKVTLTPELQAIADRSDAQEKVWETISEADLNDFSLMTNRLELSKTAASLQERKLYAFRWITGSVKRVDELAGRSVPRPLKWKIVNATTLPEMADEVDNDLRCVARLDQILVFKKWHDHEIVQQKKMERAEIGLNSGSLEGKKRKIEGRDDDVKVFTGPDHKIGSSDVVLADESIIDREAGIVDDSTPLGDLVAQ